MDTGTAEDESKLFLLPAERPANFGDNPLDCVEHALLYSLRSYRSELIGKYGKFEGNKEFTSDAGYLYYLISSTHPGEENESEEFGNDEKIRPKKKIQPGVLYRYWINYSNL
jgi:hypothetical protein